MRSENGDQKCQMATNVTRAGYGVSRGRKLIQEKKREREGKRGGRGGGRQNKELIIL